MDNDDLRRGRPTCHVAFDEATAILAGDALHTLAFEVVSRADAPPAARVEALRVLSMACGPQGLIGGQMDDLLFEGQAVDAERLDRMHRAKTGALIVAAVDGAAALAGADEEERHGLRAFASPLGLAFQIVDDILDESGSVELLGKTPGKDRAAGKATWVAVHGLDAAKRAAEERLAQSLQALAALDDARPAAHGDGSGLLRELASAIARRSA
jgi:geranylgeranyl pyrophosphate synthase